MSILGILAELFFWAVIPPYARRELPNDLRDDPEAKLQELIEQNRRLERERQERERASASGSVR
jgi:hypothetical protein